MSYPREERGSVAEAPPNGTREDGRGFDPAEAEQAEHPASFDPGLETGYLRRGARDHELPSELGAAPFDPGPERYDGRRAKRAAKRREKAERKRRERAEQQARERRERERAQQERDGKERRERLARERAQEEERVRAARERRERERELQVQRQDREREEREKAVRAHAERERLRRGQIEERERREREGEQRKRAEREQRDLAQKEERERRKQERAKRERRYRRGSKGRSGQVRLKRGSPARAKPRPARVATVPPSRTSLRIPTLKAGLAIAGVTAIALGTGALLGLPLPLGGEDKTPASASGEDPALLGIDPGTPIGLTKGPYFPVVNPTGFGEAAARFHADRGGRKHEGQDVFARPGTPLVAVRDGIVLDGSGGRNFYASGGGNTLVIYSPIDNRSYVYLHMLKPALVSAGETVSAGQLVGQLGCTGSCDGPHLHFEIRNGHADLGAETKAIDPLPLLQQWPQRPTG